MGKEFGHWLIIWASGQRDRQRALGALRAPRRCMRCYASSLPVFPRQWGGLWLPPRRWIESMCIAFQGVQQFRGRFQMLSPGAIGKVRWQWCSNQQSCTSVGALVRGPFWHKSQASSWRLPLNVSAGFTVLSEETIRSGCCSKLLKLFP